MGDGFLVRDALSSRSRPNIKMHVFLHKWDFSLLLENVFDKPVLASLFPTLTSRRLCIYFVGRAQINFLYCIV